MEKQRTIKEVLQVMLDNQHLFRWGLCRWADELNQAMLITDKEWYAILHFISSNKPKPTSGILAYYSARFTTDGYYWPAGIKRPRVNWIKKHIKALSKNEPVVDTILGS